MTLQYKLIALLLTLLVGFGTGFGIRSYMAGKEQLKAENTALTRALTESVNYQKKVEVRDAKNQALQDELAALDKDQINARTKLLTENAALRTDLGVAQRMHLKGASCPDRPAGTQASSDAGVDHGAQVQFSDETRFAVFDLRESIVKDIAALEGCQANAIKRGFYP